MKKWLCASFVVVLSLSLIGCSNTSSPGTQTEKPKSVANAKEAVDALKQAGIPIGKTDVYTAGNDPNNLLGRPGQYTSKVNFVDTRVKQEAGDSTSIDVENGGSVEMFDNADDAKKRYDYVSNIAKSTPLLTEYDYVNGKLFVRVSKELTPDLAKKYEDALKKIPQ